jgi:hypothetical protein
VLDRQGAQRTDPVDFRYPVDQRTDPVDFPYRGRRGHTTSTWAGGGANWRRRSTTLR